MLIWEEGEKPYGLTCLELFCDGGPLINCVVWRGGDGRVEIYLDLLIKGKICTFGAQLIFKHSPFPPISPISLPMSN